ncbi:hypothetical protein AGIG_G25286 [Arapaima gigas]
MRLLGVDPSSWSSEQKPSLDVSPPSVYLGAFPWLSRDRSSSERRGVTPGCCSSPTSRSAVGEECRADEPDMSHKSTFSGTVSA